MTHRPLSDQIALVTGASRGIGAATAKALAEAGAHVILVARTATDLDKVEEQIYQKGGSATIAPLDITNSGSCHHLAAAISGRWPALDIMVFAAARYEAQPSIAAASPALQQMLAVNALATQDLLSRFDPLIQESRSAHIIGLTLPKSQAPYPYNGSYYASKMAMEAILLSYGAENAERDTIKVALAELEAVATEGRKRAFPDEKADLLRSPDEVAKAIVTMIVQDYANGWQGKL
ncbi:short-chain dehydrogenase/reductase SDR [Zymomonas mobilis subsp. mobilis ZM4 = ATCC 31821]|uniref:Short-chain dehydrogenase/reductase SDR n=1 Tax=Zymomonas mobilis subsp. mobilis (strain ATCC 31821 / ZM4 / CP4) TaxID=264203 RepID=Q5NM75_ZYMMO|nr:SDR family oxidoreductase [Zymomonas mobilis]AAV90185.1 short-chain dehydrogenase/reductase SDR [Zymomonas mobilis subsp. mobilis ZM4 = ATCC 31821]AVZ26391.1 short-chain dehydrogenase/reductase SDR [Zymomonas mobilis subsp. mobilis]AVZ28278.1 short-chain dehydrogenase/reductase SDR [Zymomonas mobilis subsp. mobilis]AVZ42723.1 short-chain dehydrogenase/reductase SDR [Zymomonas mobilis subsp. mobilis ZM4 = ATCC 31821]MCP9308089.1 SDR family oxidoreductase [Zymomonas mobilis]